MILILSSSSENNIYVDASETTGESNLLVKRIITEVQALCNFTDPELILKKFIGKVKFEQPNNDYNSFDGKMHIEKYPKVLELTADNMIYRGNIFHGSDWVIGLVLYTGNETKVYLNTQTPKKKISHIEKKVNR